MPQSDAAVDQAEVILCDNPEWEEAWELANFQREITADILRLLWEFTPTKHSELEYVVPVDLYLKYIEVAVVV
jgi:hypothetical protein